MLQTIVPAVLRGVAAFILLMIVMRFIGRKAVSQMTYFDFAVGITLGSLTANMGLGPKPTLIVTASVIVTMAVMAVVTGFLSTKFFRFRKLVNSEPVVVISNGKLVEENMLKTRTTVNDLTSWLRAKNVFNIADVEFAVLENCGQLSVLLKSQKRPVTPADLKISTAYEGLQRQLIIDGEIMYENLQDAHLDETWLRAELKKQGISDVNEVFFAALDTTGKLFVSRGIEGQEEEGEYGID